jgi:cytochrome c peroxidase
MRVLYLWCAVWVSVFPLVAMAAPYRFDHKGFLATLNSNPTETELRPFYRREEFVPVRSQRFAIPPSTRALGEKLFFDTRLATTKGMGCVTCHEPQYGFSDLRPSSTERGGRRSMPLRNLAWNNRFAWAGWVNSLMSQAALAIEAPGGMATPRDAFISRLKDLPEYEPLFAQSYRGRVKPEHEISIDTVAHALEIYVSSLVSGRSDFDRWIDGDEKAISKEAKAGFMIFNTKGNCAQCHLSWRFTDGDTHDIGISSDVGRFEHEPNNPGVKFQFKTPGLRDVALRPPYMHNGSLPSLEAVIDFYNRGGNIARKEKSKHIKPLGLTAGEKSALEAFLLTLSEPPEAKH